MDTPSLLPLYQGLKCSKEVIRIPFAIKRVFFITNVPAGTQRGNHAYRHQEFLLCLQGKCSITIDDGSVQTRRTLDRPDAGLLIPANTWRTLDGFSPDCILAVFSDAHYSPADYCFDYVRFKTQLEF